MTFKRNIIYILVLIALITVVGCSSQSPEEKIVQHLEETIVLEKTFEEEQEKINSLELKDEELYNEIIQLDMDQYDKIVELADQAITYLDEREEHLQVEKESIELSKDEFLKIEKEIDKLTGENKEYGEKLFTAMTERFAAYDNVYDSYSESIELTKKLYQLLQEEEVDKQEVTSLITKVNNSYEAVFEANDEFNSKTDNYNELKKKFYQLITDSFEKEANKE